MAGLNCAGPISGQQGFPKAQAAKNPDGFVGGYITAERCQAREEGSNKQKAGPKV
jgi:hypothetical protein